MEGRGRVFSWGHYILGGVCVGVHQALCLRPLSWSRSITTEQACLPPLALLLEDTQASQLL